jgi:ABC-type oligopeptide transport system substrate-binding subunit
MPAGARGWTAAQWAAPVNLPSNGPFRLKEFSASRGVRFVPNETYGSGKPPEDLNFLVIADRSEALEKLKAGLIDGVTDATRLDYVKITAEKEGVARLLSVGALSTVYVGFNRRASLIDTELRRILARGVNRKAIVQTLGNDDREAAAFIHPLVSGGGYETPLKENQAAARADLKAWLAKKNMKTMNLRLIARSGQRAEAARALATAWQKVFPDLVLATVQDFNSKALEAKIKEGNDFDAIVAAWLVDFPDGLNFLSIFTSGQFQNVIQFMNPQYDQAVNEASQALTPTERKRQARRAEDILVGQEAAIVPLLHLNTAMLVSARALRLKMDMLQRIYFD